MLRLYVKSYSAWDGARSAPAFSRQESVEMIGRK